MPLLKRLIVWGLDAAYRTVSCFREALCAGICLRHFYHFLLVTGMLLGLCGADPLEGVAAVGLPPHNHALPVGNLARNEAAQELTKVVQVRQLTLLEAQRGYRVRLKGVITFFDPDHNLALVQDETGGIPVIIQEKGRHLRTGSNVELTGQTEAGKTIALVAQGVLRDLGRGHLPLPRRVSAADLTSGTNCFQWIEIEGIVRTATFEEGRAELELACGPHRVKAVLLDTSEFPASPLSLVDARIRLRAVSGELQASGSPHLLELFSSTATHTLEEIRAPLPFASIPLVPLARLDENFPLPDPVHRIRVRGPVKIASDGRVMVGGARQSVEVRSCQPIVFQTNDVIEVIGFPGGSASAPVLEDALLRPLAWSQPPQSDNPAQPATLSSSPELLPILTSIEEVRALSVEEASRGYPVRIEGVVTYCDGEWYCLFVQNKTSGIYISLHGEYRQLEIGQWVEVNGFSAPGHFAPIIIKPHLNVLGERPLPVALPMTIHRLLKGHEDSQRVEIEGVVRNMRVDTGHLLLTLATHGDKIQVQIPRFWHTPAPTNLVDAEVLVRGVCGTQFNDHRQLTGAIIFAHDTNCLQVIRPAPQDPFNIPLSRIDSLRKFSPRQTSEHRVRVQGIVTFRDPNWCTLFLQESNAAVYVRTLIPPRVPVGDRLEVVGFPDRNKSGIYLIEGLFRRLSAADPLPPVPVSAQQAHVGNFDGRLVRLQAILIDEFPNTDGYGLILQSEGWTFDAFLEGTQNAARLRALRKGCLLQLTGVVSLEPDSAGRMHQLWIHLRTPEDVVVLKEPPWWTPRHLYAGLSLAGGLGLAGLLWVVSLRRRVRQQTTQIREQLSRMNLLNQITRAVAERQDVQSIFRVTLSHLEEHLPVDFSSMQLFDESDRSFAVTAHGPKSRALSEKAGMREGERFPLAGTTLEPCMRGEIVYLPDMRQTDRLRPQAAVRMGILTGLGIPLSVEGKVYGALLVGRRGVDAFTGADRHFLQSLCEQIALAAYHARLRVELQSANDQLRQTRQTALQCEKLAAIGQLSAGVAHEFNNILTIIQGNAELVKSDRPLDNETAESVQEIILASQRAANLTRQLLAFSRKQVIQPQTFPLDEVVTSSSRMLQRLLGEHIRVLVECAPGTPPIHADMGMIQQVIVNLAVNARDAMPGGGTLLLRVSLHHLDDTQAIRHPEAWPGTFVCLSIIDDGCGMGPAVRDRIFEPFYTTKGVGQGTGLGLSMVYGIMRQHQGWIEVESQPGQGSKFHLFLPAASPDGLAARPPESASPELNGHETILLVEDEAPVRATLRAVLQRLGYDVVEAASGREALKIWPQCAHRVRLLLTDLVMPEGISGRELATRLRESNPRLEVIYSSGYVSEVMDRDHPLEADIKFLQKPYSTSELARLVRTCLDARAGSFN